MQVRKDKCDVQFGVICLLTLQFLVVGWDCCTCYSSVVYDAVAVLYIQSHEETSHRSGDPLDFFGVPVYLTVSGQLHAEALAW